MSEENDQMISIMKSIEESNKDDVILDDETDVDEVESSDTEDTDELQDNDVSYELRALNARIDEFFTELRAINKQSLNALESSKSNMLIVKDIVEILTKQETTTLELKQSIESLKIEGSKEIKQREKELVGMQFVATLMFFFVFVAGIAVGGFGYGFAGSLTGGLIALVSYILVFASIKLIFNFIFKKF